MALEIEMHSTSRTRCWHSVTAKKGQFNGRAASIRAPFDPHACTRTVEQETRVGASRWMGRLGADLDTHRYTHCERNLQVFPRASTLQSNSEKRFDSSV
jgi:hypothetical protein